MNLAETHDLLTLVAAYDNRRFDDATVIAWREVLAGCHFEDCRSAVVAHFRTAEAYLMPVHVVRGADELRRERNRLRAAAEAEQRRALEPAAATPGNRRAEVQALIRELRDALPDTTTDVFRRPEWLTHDRARERHLEAVPNPHYTGPPVVPTEEVS